ncbi:MAG: HD domain-containing protein [Calditrichaeota bacterium]|nr:HD domain-containing protein [Calditrichota bacterium]MCB9391591.1 HD domain-containing protein [Calditrichota bacterium]
MSKTKHEVRDPIHSFVYYDNRERGIIDSWPFQRLRDIHQLGLAHFVYPSARHTRFEHSLGVMHLAERIFLSITDGSNLRSEVKDQFSDELKDSHSRGYWRDAVRLAALCHDIGHLPFSHTAEKEVLKDGEDHETISKKLIEHEYVSQHLRKAPTVDPMHVVKLALGPEKAKKKFGIELTEWESLLSEIIVGDALDCTPNIGVGIQLV